MSKIIEILNQKKNKKGMTLMEIILVMALLAVLGSMLVKNLLPMLGSGRRDAVKIQLRNFSQDLDSYNFDCGSYPTTAQGLQALVSAPTTPPECPNYRIGGYFTLKTKKLPKDPWGGEYIYTCDDGANYVIKSLGSDKKEGGEGDAADIASDQM